MSNTDCCESEFGKCGIHDPEGRKAARSRSEGIRGILILRLQAAYNADDTARVQSRQEIRTFVERSSNDTKTSGHSPCKTRVRSHRRASERNNSDVKGAGILRVDGYFEDGGSIGLRGGLRLACR